MLRRKRPGTTKESGIRHASSRRKNCLRSVNTLVNRQLHRLRLGGRHGGRQGLKVPGLGHCVAGFRNSGAENDLGELGQGQIRDHAHPVSEGHEIERPPTRKERSQGQAPQQLLRPIALSPLLLPMLKRNRHESTSSREVSIELPSLAEKPIFFDGRLSSPTIHSCRTPTQLSRNIGYKAQPFGIILLAVHYYRWR
jgi:hypothetical protein